MSLSRLESTEAEAAVLGVAETMIDHAREQFEDQKIADRHDLYELLSEIPCDDTLALEMDLDDRLIVAEQYADDFGLELGDVTIDNVRQQIEVLAILVVYHLGLDRAYSHLSTLMEAMEDHDLSADQLLAGNPHGWARHYAERSEGPFQVYQYRNLEGEQLHFDVYEYYDIPGQSLYFQVQLDPEDVSAEENRFDAS